MITRIEYIDNFGVFSNYTWSNDLKDFNERNIIYGWNYSGKTTLSRVLTSVKNSKINADYDNAKFKIILNDGVIESNNMINNSLKVMVFNSDYIDENLKWGKDININGISFNMGDSAIIDEEIQKFKNSIMLIEGDKNNKGLIESLKNIINDFNLYESNKISDEARIIKNVKFNNLIDFNKTHFLKIMNSIENNIKSYLIEDKNDLHTVMSFATSQNDKDNIYYKKNRIDLIALYNKINEILEYIPQKADIIEYLQDDKNSYNWVKEGLNIHSDKQLCMFCGAELDKKRLDILNSFYSNEAAKLKDQINDILNQISQIKKEVMNIIIPFSKNDLYKNFETEYSFICDLIEKTKEKTIYEINIFEEHLNLKNLELFEKVNQVEYNLENNKSLNTIFNSIEDMVKKHNEYFLIFNEKQNEAREKYKKHLVAEFLIVENYIDKREKSKTAQLKLNDQNNLIKSLKVQIEQLELRKKSIMPGKEKLEKYISKFLSRSDIKIEISLDDKYILKRNGKIAKNFSDGEKTAISFTYFIIELEKLNESNELKNTIVFIDDPISSLDANHISQVYSFINDFFFKQGLSVDNPEEYVMIANQLFISTHNFEFFSFLKDSNRINKKNKFSYYFLKRNEDCANIVNLPSSLFKYKSEYVYLFSLIYSYYSNGCQESDTNLLILPNAIRRFLELYTLMKLPGSRDEVDARIKILYPEFSELKVLHHFSHFTCLDYVSKHDELILNLPMAVDELIKILKSDVIHYTSLKSAL